LLSSSQVCTSTHDQDATLQTAVVTVVAVVVVVVVLAVPVVRTAADMELSVEPPCDAGTPGNLLSFAPVITS